MHNPDSAEHHYNNIMGRVELGVYWSKPLGHLRYSFFPYSCCTIYKCTCILYIMLLILTDSSIVYFELVFPMVSTATVCLVFTSNFNFSTWKCFSYMARCLDAQASWVLSFDFLFKELVKFYENVKKLDQGVRYMCIRRSYFMNYYQ